MDKKGFTLIEVVATVAIIAILASMVIPVSRLSAKRMKEMELRENLRTMRKAIDDYKRAWDEGRIKKNIGDSGYPASLEILVKGVNDILSPQGGKKIRFLRRIPEDPMNADTTLKPEETWGLRCYQSDPDFPEEGDDVFDIYSKSEEKGLDGTAYKTW